jgi:hypothetical protein
MEVCCDVYCSMLLGCYTLKASKVQCVNIQQKYMQFTLGQALYEKDISYI